MAYDDIYRYAAAQNLTLQSVGGAAQSTAALGTETYAIQLCYPGSASSTGGVRFAVIDTGAAAVSSTQGALLPANWPLYVKCTPGQRISAISNDAGLPTLSIVELTK